MKRNTIYIYNTAVLINICRFLINVVKLCKPLSKLDLPTLRKGSREEKTQQYIYIYNLISNCQPCVCFEMSLYCTIFVIHIGICIDIFEAQKVSELFTIYFLSSVLPLRSVGRSNFDKGLHNLTTLIKKRHILMKTAALYNGINSGQL